jgi:prepilin-type N-terminal cleavage/methylation domain-containing protein
MGNRVYVQLQRGFTLIELLVVIAIITVLSSILFPVFGKVREKARQTMCASNQRQIGLGFLQYAQDYDDNLPGRIYGGQTFRAALEPYLKSGKGVRSVWKCPSNADQKSNIDVSGYISTFTLNNTMDHFATWKPGLPLNSVGELSDKILMTEIKVRIWTDYNSP